VTGEAAEELVADRLEALHQLAAALGVADLEVPARVEVLAARLRDSVRAARQPKDTQAATLDAAAALAGAQEAGDVKVIVQHYPEADADALRRLVDDLRGRTGRFVAIAAGNGSGPILVVAASRDLTGEGFDAVQIVRQVGPLIGGGGRRTSGAGAGRRQQCRGPGECGARGGPPGARGSGSPRGWLNLAGSAVQQLFGGVRDRLRGGRPSAGWWESLSAGADRHGRRHRVREGAGGGAGRA
jgi:hypothetical protein